MINITQNRGERKESKWRVINMWRKHKTVIIFSWMLKIVLYIQYYI